MNVFIADFVKSLCLSGEVSLFESRSNSWEIIPIDPHILNECFFIETHSIIQSLVLTSKSGVEISHLYMIKSDVETAILRLRQATPLIKALPAPTGIKGQG